MRLLHTLVSVDDNSQEHFQRLSRLGQGFKALGYNHCGLVWWRRQPTDNQRYSWAARIKDKSVGLGATVSWIPACRDVIAGWSCWLVLLSDQCHYQRLITSHWDLSAQPTHSVACTRALQRIPTTQNYWPRNSRLGLHAAAADQYDQCRSVDRQILFVVSFCPVDWCLVVCSRKEGTINLGCSRTFICSTIINIYFYSASSCLEL